jgi:uncharacterized membrane protein (DUF485 family)
MSEDIGRAAPRRNLAPASRNSLDERRRRRFCLTLALIVVVIWLGYALLVGFGKGLMAERIGETATLGLYVSGLVALIPWLLTVVYVVWGNRNAL